MKYLADIIKEKFKIKSINELSEKQIKYLINKINQKQGELKKWS